MKKIVLISFLFLLQKNIFSQEINFDNISIGITVQYLMPKDDLGEYWRPSIAAGLSGRYDANELITLTGEATIAKYSVIESKNTINAPDITFLNISAGIMFNQYIANNFSAFIGFGVDNNTFAFTGENAKVLGSNHTESEFGVFVKGGIDLNFKSFPLIAIYFKAEEIFTDPKRINIYKISMNVYFF